MACLVLVGAGDHDGDCRGAAAFMGSSPGDRDLYPHVTVDSGNHAHMSYRDVSGGQGHLGHANGVRNRIADFNGDGKSDLCWHTSANDTVNFWFMNGTAISGEVQVGQVSDLSWRIEGLADFNNDNKADILCRTRPRARW